MRFPIKRGTKLYLGSMPLTALENTEFAVEARDMDHIAEMMASAGPRAFGEHLESLKHRDTKRKTIEGVEHEVDVMVSYGAGGARIEKEFGEPRRLDGKKVKTAGAGTQSSQQQSEFQRRGGVGTETIPGASGSGNERDMARLPHRKQSEDDEDDAPGPSSPRTEFIVPPKRFPDEVQTPTDPPREDVVADSPDRAVPYVGEFVGDGSFTRQPSPDQRATNRSEAEGRPLPSPDTPGTRDRALPAPSETAKERPDQTARQLEQMKQNQDEDRSTAEDDDQDMSQLSDEDEADDLPEDFPHRAALEKAGVTKWSELEGKSAEDLSGDDFKGIGPSHASDILAEVKKKKRRDAARERKRSQK